MEILLAAFLLVAATLGAFVAVAGRGSTPKASDPPDSPGCITIVDEARADDPGGWVKAEVIRDGPRGPEVVRRVISHNLVINTGKRQIWRVLTGLNAATFDQGRIGSGSAAANSANTNLQTPITGTLNTVDSKTLLAGTRTVRLIWSYPSGGGSKSATVRECVILNQNTSPGGSALMRAVITSTVKTTADKLKITWNARVA